MPRGIRKRRYTKRDPNVGHWQHVISCLLQCGKTDIVKELLPMACEECPSCKFGLDTVTRLRVIPTRMTGVMTTTGMTTPTYMTEEE